MEELDVRIDKFLSEEANTRLNNWVELLSIGREFNVAGSTDIRLAKKIAVAILNHRSLMGSSKAYESAFEIDTDLLEVSVPIARVAFGKTKPLTPFLESAIYYSRSLPQKFNKELLEREVNEIKALIK